MIFYKKNLISIYFNVELIVLIVGNPNLKKMHSFGFVGIFEYIC